MGSNVKKYFSDDSRPGFLMRKKYCFHFYVKHGTKIASGHFTLFL